MAYKIKKTIGNGYRCGCCHRSWKSKYEVDTLEEALEEVPLENDGRSQEDFESILEVIEVIDLETGYPVAWGRLSYPHGGSRGVPYKATRWKGQRGDVEFDSAGGDEAWEQKLQEIKEEDRLFKIKKAEDDLKAAERKLAWERNRSSEPRKARAAKVKRRVNG
jgi:hypothetical protein